MNDRAYGYKITNSKFIFHYDPSAFLKKKQRTDESLFIKLGQYSPELIKGDTGKLISLLNINLNFQYLRSRISFNDLHQAPELA